MQFEWRKSDLEVESRFRPLSLVDVDVRMFARISMLDLQCPVAMSAACKS